MGSLMDDHSNSNQSHLFLSVAGYRMRISTGDLYIAFLE